MFARQLHLFSILIVSKGVSEETVDGMEGVKPGKQIIPESLRNNVIDNKLGPHESNPDT